MQIAAVLAGFTPSEADDLRKAMGKKNKEVMGNIEQLLQVHVWPEFTSNFNFLRARVLFLFLSFL